jgi:cation/acetate symporter
MSIPLLMFLGFIAITLWITYWAAGRSSGASAFFAANRQITGWQNGLAVAGDYMSAASFLGIAGIISRVRRVHVFGWLAGSLPDGAPHCG